MEKLALVPKAKNVDKNKSYSLFLVIISFTSAVHFAARGRNGQWGESINGMFGIHIIL